MAVTVTRRGDLPYRIAGAQRKTVSNVAFDSSYLSGGETLSASDLGLTRVDYAECTIYTTATTTVNAASVGYDPAAGLIHVFDETPAEVTSTQDLAGLVAQVVAYGV